MRSTVLRLLSAFALAAGLALVVAPAPPTDGVEKRDGFPRGGARLFADAGRGDPEAIWGSVDCAERSRVRTRHGARRLSVHDDDRYFGERCELGLNDHRSGPTAVYREGERRITLISIKLGSGFPMDTYRWQVVMQMKEAQPYGSADPSGGVALDLQAFDGRWRLLRTTRGGEREQVWSAPAKRGRWTRFAFDGLYSADPGRGSLRVYVDRNGDGDALDRHERSRRFRFATLKTERSGSPENGLETGATIPSHLRVGVYHDPSYGCQGSRCSVAIDDVEILAP